LQRASPIHRILHSDKPTRAEASTLNQLSPFGCGYDSDPCSGVVPSPVCEPGERTCRGCLYRFFLLSPPSFLPARPDRCHAALMACAAVESTRGCCMSEYDGTGFHFTFTAIRASPRFVRCVVQTGHGQDTAWRPAEIVKRAASRRLIRPAPRRAAAHPPTTTLRMPLGILRAPRVLCTFPRIISCARRA